MAAIAIETAEKIGNRSLLRKKLRNFAAKLLPAASVAKCGKNVVPGQSHVDVIKCEYSVYYRNLVQCGSIWTCAVCAAKISERRRVQWQKAIDASGLFSFMITYTIKHNRTDKLSDLLKLIDSARALYKSGRWYQTFEFDNQIVGCLRALELTYSPVNGWHVHIHELYLALEPLTHEKRVAMDKSCKHRWQDMVRKCGGDATIAHGLVISFNTPEQYLIKTDGDQWTFVSELTKANLKMASDSHYTPFQLLDLAQAGHAAAAALFIEYAAAIKGSHYLQPSPGFIDILDTINAAAAAELRKTDAELLEDDQAQGEAVYMRFSRQLWYFLLSEELLYDVTMAIRSAGTPADVWEYIIWRLGDHTDRVITRHECHIECLYNLRQLEAPRQLIK